MKNLFLLTALLVVTMTANAQNCSKPLPDDVFVREMNRLKSVPQEMKRLQMAKELGQRACLLTRQARQVAKLLVSEDSKLEFAESVYFSIYDKNNVYYMYDFFSAFSTAMRFHDYLESLKYDNNYSNGNINNQDGYYDQYDKPYHFPDYYYPSYDNYSDVSPCSHPVSNEVFNRFVRDILKYKDDDSRMDAAVQLAESNCLSVEQIIKLGSILDQEPKRMIFLKRTYDYTYDRNNYNYGNQLFKDNNNITEFDNYVRDRRSKGQYIDRSGSGFNRNSTETNNSSNSGDRSNNMNNNGNDRNNTGNTRTNTNNNQGNNSGDRNVSNVPANSDNRNNNSDRNNVNTDRNVPTNDRSNTTIEREKNQTKTVCVVTELEMNEISTNIKAQSMDNNKLSSLKQVVAAKKCFTVAQIKQMVEMLIYETNKVDFAKFCYPYCIDRTDYYKINSSFSFSRSVDDMNKFIQDQQHP